MDRPISYLFIGLLVGVLSCTLYLYTNILIASLCIAIYFYILIKTLRKNVVNTVLCYSLLGVATFNFYFHYNLPKNFVETRIVENKGYYVIGEFNGRKLKIINEVENLKTGRKYVLNGNFKKMPIYEKGIVGTFEVKVFLKEKDDFICSIYDLKSELFNKFTKRLGKYNTAILMGVCYGDSTYLSYDDMDEFNTLGITHVISVSGLHTSLIYGVLKGIVGYKIALVILFVYVMFTGAKAATVRAFIMIVVLVLAPKLRKNYDSISALSFSAFILLLIKPYYLLDVGYCLSFLGMLGIYLFYKKIRRTLYKIPTLINDSLSLTIAASIFTVPYIIFIFKTYSIGGFISNLIVLPFYTFIVVIGNIALLTYKIQPIFNILATMLSSIFYIISTAQNFLLSIIPPPLNFTYMEGLALVILYPTYMLIKRGYKALIYMPLALVILIMVDSYKFFPEINFINIGNTNVIAINYRFKTLLISPIKVKLNKIYENILVDKIYDEIDEEEDIFLGNKYKVKIKREKTQLILIFDENYKKIVFLQEDLFTTESNNELVNRLRTKDVFLNDKKQNLENTILYRSDNFPYDIIRVVKDPDRNFKGRYYKSYTIIMGKALEGYIH